MRIETMETRRGMLSLVIAVLVIALGACEVGRVVAEFGGYGLEAALYQGMKDPLAENDTFLSLSPSLKRLLSHPAGFDVDAKREALLAMESSTLLRVKLVGFSEDRRRLSHLESQLTKYIEALNQDIHANVIGHEPHRLMAKTRINLEVEKVYDDLGERIHDAIDQNIRKSEALRTPYQHHVRLPKELSDTLRTPFQHHEVPHEVVDDLIKAQLETPLPSYTIFLLNLKPQTQGKYAYVYSKLGAFSHHTRCLGTLWAGKDRYVWVDLAAGPVEYGPATSGEGYVKGEMLPLASSYGAGQENAFAADLASLVWSAARMLVAPAVRIPVQFAEDLEVQFIHIKGGVNEEEADLKGLDFKALEAQLLEEGDGLLFSKQNLKFKYASVKLSECSECSSAFSRAIRTYTARILLDNYSLFLDEYLDSKELHHFLKEYGEELADEAGLRRADGMTRVIPVYVWDLDIEKQMLLDRFHQIMPFRDMVIAVRTVMQQTVIEYSCNGRQLLTPTRDLQRPIVGALLQSLFGVAPTHLTWSSHHNSTVVDYRWGVGNTPFGPFSQLSSLSFAQRDASKRNTILTMLNETMSHGLELLRQIKNYGGEKEFLGMKQHLEYTQRWNLLVYKLNKVMSALSHFEFDRALYFLRSTEHDIFAIHRFAYDSSFELEASLKCFEDAPFPWIPLFLGSGVVGVFVYVWMKRDKLFVNKKKRF